MMDEIEKLIDEIDPPLKTFVIEMCESHAYISEDPTNLYQQYYEYYRKRCEEAQKERDLNDKRRKNKYKQSKEISQ